MATKIEICNSAIVSLAGNQINDLDDGSTEANACKVLFDQVRRSELRKHPWRFAIKRKKLARSTTDPVYKYDYRYALPSDCLRVLEEYQSVDWKIEGRYVYTNSSEVYIRYVADITDTSLWDAGFVEVMIARLAYRLAYLLPRSGSMIDRMAQYYDEVWMMATATDSLEDIPDPWNGGANPYIDRRYES